MPPLDWLPFALAAPALWAASNLIDASLLEENTLTPLALLVLTGAFMGLPALVVALSSGLAWPGWSVVLLAAGAGAFGILAYLPYFYALQRATPAAVLLMWNLTPVFVVLGAGLFLGEALLPRQYLALPLLLVSSAVGAYLLHGRPRLSPALPWMVVASLLLATASVLEKATFEIAEFSVGLAWISLCSFSVAVFTAGLSGDVRNTLKRRLDRGIAGAVVTNHLLDVGAFCALSAATSLGPVSLVHATGGLQPIFVLLLQARSGPRLRPIMVVAAVGLAAIGLALAEG